MSLNHTDGANRLPGVVHRHVTGTHLHKNLMVRNDTSMIRAGKDNTGRDLSGEGPSLVDPPNTGDTRNLVGWRTN
jgi:hypothetical protein